MKKKIFWIISSSTILSTAFFVIIIVALLMVLNFFGVSITDNYVEGNIEYASSYLEALNNNVDNGYVSLDRILYFSLSATNLTFDKIYIDNIDVSLKQVLPVSTVCLKMEYKLLDVCKIISNAQIDSFQIKPFAKPVDFENMRITSFFMEERYVFDTYSVHYGWDFALAADSPVYSVCDGTIIASNFSQTTNTTDTTMGMGNTIVQECEIDGNLYNIKYGHLFPVSSIYNVGDLVKKGKQIAGVGTTGYSTGNHLHFEVRKNDVLVDGMSLIDFNFEIEEDFIENEEIR